MDSLGGDPLHKTIKELTVYIAIFQRKECEGLHSLPEGFPALAIVMASLFDHDWLEEGRYHCSLILT
jgi:hypothetical protein